MNSKRIEIFPSEISGEIYLSGAKNSALKLQTATLLTDRKITITNYPSAMLDIIIQEEMLCCLGKSIVKDHNRIEISGPITTNQLIWEKRSIRNSLLILGSLLTRTGAAKVPIPGGCQLGDRKFEIHFELIKAFGGIVWQEENYLIAKTIQGARLKACEFTLPIRSTGATENAILMAVMAVGKTRIWNPHIRPEIIDLVRFLNKLGAKIIIRGQESIIVEGVEELINEIEYEVLADNMQAITYLISGGLAANELLIKNFPYKDLEVPLIFLKEAGLKYYRHKNEIIVKKCESYPVDISTGPYPGINSDMQPLFAAWGCLSRGTSIITDLRFVGRYGYAEEMRKLGVNSSIQNNRLIINGSERLLGAEVNAIDLRAGAALMTLSLIAENSTIINDFWMIERGYNDVLNVLASINVRYNILEKTDSDQNI
ncbi:MAG: UDP-N-acetylglucosamine 1-carboxyvinyltransferase [Paludibacter sp.]|jgi:UDP-N-acetylglucosamine 1-carboxyvinyltransferase|nr:UDP-N-acetylglucosamine 1-carboxyvinyltransferase [Paludibacter sp.]